MPPPELAEARPPEPVSATPPPELAEARPPEPVTAEPPPEPVTTELPEAIAAAPPPDPVAMLPLPLPPPAPPPPPETVRAAPPRPAPRPPAPSRPAPAEAPTEAAAPAPAAPSPARVQPPANYIGALLAALDRHKEYPSAARFRRAEGVAYLRFAMRRDGTVASFRIERSSGHEDLDDSVMEMIRRASPLPRPPPEMPGDPVELVVPVRFSLR
jgi:protein TonB